MHEGARSQENNAVGLIEIDVAAAPKLDLRAFANHKRGESRCALGDASTIIFPKRSVTAVALNAIPEATRGHEPSVVRESDIRTHRLDGSAAVGDGVRQR